MHIATHGIVASSVGGATPAFTNTLSTTFDGADDYVDFGNGTSLQITGAFTFSVWTKLNSTVGPQSCIMSKDNGTTQRAFTLWGKITNIPVSYIWSGGSNYSVGGTTNIADDNWHHVAVVYVPSTSLRIYVDGVLEGTNTTSIPASINNATQNLYLGQFASSLFEFKGNIDEVSLFNTELSASDVTSIYNSGTPNDISAMSGLVSWWRMGDGDTYPTITDNAGSNDGLMKNMSAANFVADVP